MKAAGNSAERGFTLLEMLIAMAVFAVLSVMAYQGLRAVLNADYITREQGQRLADLQVTLSVLERDLAQVVAITGRDEFGDPLPPLRLRAGGESQLLELLRAGAGGEQRLRRTAWQITNRGLERRLWPGVDVVDPDSMRRRAFADLVGEGQVLGGQSAFLFIVRTPAGLQRVASWPPADADEAATALPVAIEIVLDVPGLGEIRRLLAVGL